MAKLLWALICSRVLIDQQTNNVSYIDAIEQFAVPSFPYVFPPIALAMLWWRDRGEEQLNVRVRLFDPGKKMLMSYKPDPPLAMVKPRHRVHLNLAGAPINGPGRHHLMIEQFVAKKWQEQTSVPIEVGQFEQEEVAPKASKRKTRKTP